MRDTSTPFACPPHHWLIVDATDGHQHWTCQRCGAQQVHTPLAPPTWHGGPPARLPKRLAAPSD
jgi:hypothetical protein